MTSGGNNFNNFPENQQTKYSDRQWDSRSIRQSTNWPQEFAGATVCRSVHVPTQ